MIAHFFLDLNDEFCLLELMGELFILPRKLGDATGTGIGPVNNWTSWAWWLHRVRFEE